ncbi:damage-inducible protein [Xaviernesmea oryzae]|uniref:Damage-inducible protein n=1 Tax=Xaviernesmea oryzae TaxID=464029 RepID=A0A1Q9ATT7_9HYPH|nr:ImuA family protein [Xaviernesmea oryzae]OLP58845.1 damage-inducible protein [Xaviernesmea oryzae]
MPEAPLRLAELRARIERIEGTGSRVRQVLPFGLAEIDNRLPGGGLALGALHEVAGGGNGTVDGAAGALFTAGIAARTRGKVLWCITEPDLFAPALAQAGLAADRVIYVEAGDDKTVLACMEEALRHGGLGAAVGEVARLSMTASRRLQLAAEGTGSLGLALRRWRRQVDASDFGQPTAAMTRWRVSVLPSVALPVPGVGRARWLVELIRARAGESADFELEACDGAGCLALPADLAHRPAAAQGWRHSTSA